MRESRRVSVSAALIYCRGYEFSGGDMALATKLRPPFENIALVLQGGGALGACQAGVYEALAAANIHPDWIAGISIGAINGALIAGNAPEARVANLRVF
jgi:NTE family protein